jgi:hypothetical protein
MGIPRKNGQDRPERDYLFTTSGGVKSYIKGDYYYIAKAVGAEKITSLLKEYMRDNQIPRCNRARKCVFNQHKA